MPLSSPAIEKSFCTTKEASTLLGVSVGTVQLWVESGLLQAWKTAGGHRRVIRESVERLLHKSQEPGATRPTLATPYSAPEAAARLRVLVAEDDPSLLRLYQAKISAWPVAPQVTVVSNGFAALLTMGRTSPDLLITDLRMPGLDGFAMLRTLEKVPEAAHTRIVVVSGLDRAEIEAQGGLPSGIEVLPKPVPFERLQHIASAIATQHKRLGFENP